MIELKQSHDFDINIFVFFSLFLFCSLLKEFNTSSNIENYQNHQVITMAVLRRFLCLELETTALVIGFISILLSAILRIAFDAPRGPCLVWLLVSWLLIYGTAKRNRYFLIPWLIMHFIVCGIAALSFLIVFVTIVVSIEKVDKLRLNINYFDQYYGMSESEAKRSTADRVIVGIIYGAVCVLVVYMFKAIASLYSQLRDEEQQEAVGYGNQQKIEMSAQDIPPPPYNIETC